MGKKMFGGPKMPKAQPQLAAALPPPVAPALAAETAKPSSATGELRADTGRRRKGGFNLLSSVLGQSSGKNLLGE